MRAIPRACLAAAVALPLTACAATIPSTATFEPSAWRAVEALQAGTPVEVAYVAGAPRPLRHTFRGRIESVDATHLVLRTEEGPQRLLAERVLRVAVGKGRNWSIPATVVGAMFGVAVATVAALIDESAGSAATAVGGGAIGAVLGFTLGSRRDGAPPVIVYSRKESR